jgi:hypothetical protein
VSAREVTPAELKARLSPAQQAEVDGHLAAGRGVALYADGMGAPRLIVSYGPHRSGADITGLPPRSYGQSDWEIGEYVAPLKAPAAMRFPVSSWEPVPQITAPPRWQNRTQYPQVLLAGQVEA